MTGFVDQGGDPTGTGTGGPGYSFNGGAPKSASGLHGWRPGHGQLGQLEQRREPVLLRRRQGWRRAAPLYSYFGQVTSGMTVVNKINADGSSSSTGPRTVVHKILKVTISVS